MYGTKGKIGLVVPSNNTVVEREFMRLLPAEYLAVATRMWNTQTEKSDLEQMTGQAERGARELSTAQVDVVAFACTSGSFLHGTEWEAALAQRLAEAAGCPIVTTSGAVVKALRTLGVTSVVVGTPYPDDINERERAFLEEQGVQVHEIVGFSIRESVRIGHLPANAARDLVLRLDHKHANGVFVSCTNFRTIDVIDELEQAVGKPVVTSNQATLWQCLKILGFDAHLEKGGVLLREGFSAKLAPAVGDRDGGR